MLFYYLYNGHGDVVQMVDESGNIVNSYKYDEWGNITEKQETIENPIRYAGEYYDDESGLYYLRARYYDPVIGRFITRDSYEGQLTNPLTLNQYTYCVNNPLIYVDPSGHRHEEGAGFNIEKKKEKINLETVIKETKRKLTQETPVDVCIVPMPFMFYPQDPIPQSGSVIIQVQTNSNTSQVVVNNQVGNSFDVYVEATKLKGVAEKDLLAKQEKFLTPDVPGKNYVKPDYSIYDTNGKLAAIGDAKTSMNIPYDAQAQGFIKAAQTTTSKTIIYYTPTGNSTIASELLRAAINEGIRIMQIGVN